MRAILPTAPPCTYRTTCLFISAALCSRQRPLLALTRLRCLCACPYSCVDRVPFLEHIPCLPLQHPTPYHSHTLVIPLLLIYPPTHHTPHYLPFTAHAFCHTLLTYFLVPWPPHHTLPCGDTPSPCPWTHTYTLWLLPASPVACLPAFMGSPAACHLLHCCTCLATTHTHYALPSCPPPTPYAPHTTY